MESQTFDLFPNARSNDIFRVSFDFYTPRPHFVILPKIDQIDNINPEFSRMTSEQVSQLVEAAKTMLEISGVDRGTLSIHRGSWISAQDKFLAHLCVDVERYLEVFSTRKSEIPNWPSSQYVTKQWKASKEASSYPKNVRGYPYRSYLNQEVAEIRKIRYLASDSRGNGLTKYAGFNVVYHSSHPKIGFLGEKVKSTKHLQKVLLVMENYAKEQGLTTCGSRDENSGCHVCLYLGAAETQEWGFPVEVTSAYDIVGYIVTTGLRFYKLCPPEQRQSWFKAFEMSKFVCVT